MRENTKNELLKMSSCLQGFSLLAVDDLQSFFACICLFQRNYSCGLDLECTPKSQVLQVGFQPVMLMESSRIFKKQKVCCHWGMFSRAAVFNLLVQTTLTSLYLQNICVIIYNGSKIAVMKQQQNNFMAVGHHDMNCIKGPQCQEGREPLLYRVMQP